MATQQQFKDALSRTSSALLVDVLKANRYQSQMDSGNSQLLVAQGNMIRTEMLKRREAFQHARNNYNTNL